MGQRPTADTLRVVEPPLRHKVTRIRETRLVTVNGISVHGHHRTRGDDPVFEGPRMQAIDAWHALNLAVRDSDG